MTTHPGTLLDNDARRRPGPVRTTRDPHRHPGPHPHTGQGRGARPGPRRRGHPGRLRVPKGQAYLTTAPSAAILVQTLWTAKLGSRTAKIMFAGLDGTPGRLEALRRLTETGELRPVIDRHYPLHRIADAHRHVDTARKVGTVVLTPSHDTATPTPGQE